MDYVLGKFPEWRQFRMARIHLREMHPRARLEFSSPIPRVLLHLPELERETDAIEGPRPPASRRSGAARAGRELIFARTISVRVFVIDRHLSDSARGEARPLVGPHFAADHQQASRALAPLALCVAKFGRGRARHTNQRARGQIFIIFGPGARQLDNSATRQLSTTLDNSRQLARARQFAAGREIKCAQMARATIFGASRSA
ncbi:Hypothetical predicted protein [Olea europaea subsp. europaea]|uniref:Uncharacterized protein n=1 Tax=Olea europaea subsp. europaea TaxID=158383 RepID=A0A8S0RBU8_OLEEU|nr:Hypothetical predicted protein [Olea europaea subsp. europaea]